MHDKLVINNQGFNSFSSQRAKTEDNVTASLSLEEAMYI